MKIKNKMRLDDLYFGVVLSPLSYSSQKERNKLKVYNLFDFANVKYSVALWVLMKPEDKAAKESLRDQLLWCFGDVWSRSEFEFVVCPWGGLNIDDKVVDVGVKKDTFSMYVEPNGELLMDLVNRVTRASARKFVREWRRNYRRK